MIKISYIKEIKDTHLLRLGITEGEETSAYTVNEQTYSEVGRPIRGEEIGESELEIIKHFDEYYKAKKRALSLLSYTDNNERGIQMKLRARGVSQNVAMDVAREMVSLGYINEEEQLERLILSEANQKLRGASKIIPHLASKGYSVSFIKRVLSELVERGDIDFKKNAARLLEKKLPNGASADEKKKLLFKNGFNIGG